MNTTLKRTTAIITTLLITVGLFAGIASAKSDKDKENKKDMRPVAAHETKKLSNAVSVRIGENGKVSAKNAAVTGISGTTIYTGSSWGSATVSWAIQTDASVKIRSKGTDTTRFADIKIGDRIDFDGMILGGTGPISVRAETITNLSLSRPNTSTTFEGKLMAMASTTAPTTLTVMIDDINRTVNVAADTSILTRLWAKTTLTRFTIGDTIRIYGATNASGSIDATVVRDTAIWL